jgi:beta-lactamase superfamily II metal-dependent hydrolase
MFADVSGPSFIFWPVGCGDTTSIVVSDTEVVQIDINDKLMADEDGNEHIPIVDELVAKLPKRNGKPYLSCFVLTHPDLDHCRGFEDLLKRVTIGEIWHTPRIFREYEDAHDLCADAQAFRKEAHRRAKRSIAVGGDPGPGDRVRIIGYASELFEPGERYHGFPERFYTRPGKTVVTLDATNVADRFHVFIHAPFKDGLADERNETSLAMQVVIGPGNPIRGLFLGDLSYPTLMQVFEETHRHDNDEMLQWNVLLAPHHCSKKVMYERDAEGNDVLQQDVLDEFSACQLDTGYIVASSNEFPHSNSSGDNPPHRKARNRYEEIVNMEFVCTGEFSTPENVRPIIFTATENGMILAGDGYQMSEMAENTLAAAIAAARGTNAPPTTKVGFGNE